MYNDEQLAVINHKKGPAAVLSSAGSGKTATIIGRIRKLIQTVAAERLVAVTFTNAAAETLVARAAKADERCKNIVACTYHKYCGKMLRKYGKAIGISPSFEVLTGSKYKTMIEYVESLSGYYDELKDFPSSTKLDTIFSQIINTDASIRSLIRGTKYEQYEAEIQNLYHEVKKYGFENQKLNFDDMLVYMNDLLNVDDICYKIANSFDYLMVDEFQDTNKLQLNILLKLSKYNKNIVIVGDISQSIYKFRGAQVQNINDFIDSFEDCSIYRLSTNYRSTQQILDATNDIMNRHVRSWDYTNMSANNKEGKLPVLVYNKDSYAQADWLVGQIERILKAGYELDQIAIIERKSMSSFNLENALLKAKIPFEKRGGLKFTEYVCVDEILSFLSILVKKNDKFSWFNVLKLIPGIGSKTASEISQHCNEPDFLQQYQKRKFNNDLNELEKNLAEYKKYIKDLPKLFDTIIEYYFGLKEYKIEHSRMSNSAKFDAREKLQKERKIAAILKDMSTGYTKVISFLEDIALDSISNKDDYSSKLIITTIHSAKGLEWPITFLIDCIEFEMQDEEEELRCLYVAMTRAEDYLFISIPRTTIQNGLPVFNEPVHFLNDSKKYFKEVSLV